MSNNIKQIVIPKLANEHGVNKQSSSFSFGSHVLVLIIDQLSHASGLNDICDTLLSHRGALTTICETMAPRNNGFYFANRTRNADVTEDLFRRVFEHLEKISPGERLQERMYCANPVLFKQMINVVGSMTIQLVAYCIDWAEHRRRKAADLICIRSCRVLFPAAMKPKKREQFAPESMPKWLWFSTRHMLISSILTNFCCAAFSGCLRMQASSFENPWKANF